jgi:nitrogen fixation/metabolism regulation signal transduction histidine kinase
VEKAGDRLMKWNKSADGSLAVLLSLILLYIFLIVLILVFSSQILTDLSRDRTITGPLVLGLAVLFSLILLGTILVNLFKLFRETAAGKAGSRFKFRLVLFFLAIILLSSVPQGLLSINFINTSMQSWFSNRIAEALRGGLTVAMEYYNDKVNILQNLTRNRFIVSVLENADREGSQVWETVRLVSAEIDCFQAISPEGKTLFAAGDPEGFIEEEFVAAAPEGLLPRETRSQGRSILRVKKTIENRRGQFFVVMSIVLPRTFDKHAEELTSTLETFSQLEQYRSIFLAAVSIFYAFFSFPLLLLAILVSFILSEEIIRPIVNLEEATRRVAEGDFSYRVLSRSKDDLSMLAGSFNKMVSELEKSRLKIMQTEKVAAWQEIAQRLAHEIKNPLTPIKLSAQRLLKRYNENPEDFERVLDSSVGSIIREVDNLDNLLTEFRNFSRLPAPRRESVVLITVIREVVSTYRYTIDKIAINWNEVPESISLSLDRGQIKQVFANLIRNAVDAMPKGGELTFRADLVKKGNTKYCRIQIEDTGEGIRKEDFNQVFNPYYTTKSHGTGLGLSIVERIISDHKGQIWFESEPGIGTTFFIDLPTE